MKICVFLSLSLVLLSATSLCAQGAEPAPASELARLRLGYLDSLHRLLQRCVESEDVAAAVQVSQELDHLAAAAPVDAAPDLSPCGKWQWPGGDAILIAPDGIASHPGWKTKGVWRWKDESKHQFRILWQDGFVDEAAVSPDGRVLQLANNHGERFLARRLSVPDKAAAGPGARH